MYICICNAITEKQLQENSFLLALVGSKCGKCLEKSIHDKERMLYLTDTKDKSSKDGKFRRI